MGIQERILLLFSREPDADDQGSGIDEWTVDDALMLLESEFSDFGSIVSSGKIVDFGCGAGYQSIALVRKHGCSVVGIDSNERALKRATENARRLGIPRSELRFAKGVTEDMLGKFDVVISQNSFEHFDDPGKSFDCMQRLLGETGKIVITFGPPWLAPYGSHMRFFCKLPWVNVFFSEKAVMSVRNRFRNDGATRYEEIEAGLNRMTIAKFERIIRSGNMKVDSISYKCLKGMDVLSKAPFLREFFVNHISAVLSKGA